MAPGPVAWRQTLTEADGTYTLTVDPQRGQDTFQPINRNGSQRGGRPIIAYLPTRVTNIRLIEGAEFHPTIADDFLLVPNPQSCDPEQTYQVVFQADPVE